MLPNIYSYKGYRIVVWVKSGEVNVFARDPTRDATSDLCHSCRSLDAAMRWVDDKEGVT